MPRYRGVEPACRQSSVAPDDRSRVGDVGDLSCARRTVAMFPHESLRCIIDDGATHREDELRKAEAELVAEDASLKDWG